MGVSIVSAMAFDAKRARELQSLAAGHLFVSSTTRVTVRRGCQFPDIPVPSQNCSRRTYGDK